MDNWKNIRCVQCGSSDYTSNQKNNNLVINCAKCGSFIGNKPTIKEHYKEHCIPFGKYKGQKVWLIDDLNYLRWVKDTLKISATTRNAIEWKLNGKGL